MSSQMQLVICSCSSFVFAPSPSTDSSFRWFILRLTLCNVLPSTYRTLCASTFHSSTLRTAGILASVMLAFLWPVVLSRSFFPFHACGVLILCLLRLDFFIMFHIVESYVQWHCCSCVYGILLCSFLSLVLYSVMSFQVSWLSLLGSCQSETGGFCHLWNFPGRAGQKLMLVLMLLRRWKQCLKYHLWRQLLYLEIFRAFVPGQV